MQEGQEQYVATTEPECCSFFGFLQQHIFWDKGAEETVGCESILREMWESLQQSWTFHKKGEKYHCRGFSPSFEA